MEIIDILKMIAPGTSIREGLDNILKAKTGALIVIGDDKEVMNIVDGGFNINVDYNPARLYELAKMDGAIILSSDMKKILLANVQLTPSFSIQSSETGTRHRTAERTAKQTGNIVISISQRRSFITIYDNNSKYILEDTARVSAKANQALQTVEKYRKVFDTKINMLNEYEFNDIATLKILVETIQRIEMLMKIADEVQKSIYELGVDGRLIQMQLDELTAGVEQEEVLLLKDYVIKKDPYEVLIKLRKLNHEELIDEKVIAKLIGMHETANYDEVAVYTRGYRILTKIPRMPDSIVDNIVKKFKSFQNLLSANVKKLNDVDGVGDVRAKTIVQSLKRMQEQFVFNDEDML